MASNCATGLAQLPPSAVRSVLMLQCEVTWQLHKGCSERQIAEDVVLVCSGTMYMEAVPDIDDGQGDLLHLPDPSRKERDPSASPKGCHVHTRKAKESTHSTFRFESTFALLEKDLRLRRITARLVTSRCSWKCLNSPAFPGQAQIYGTPHTVVYMYIQINISINTLHTKTHTCKCEGRETVDFVRQ